MNFRLHHFTAFGNRGWVISTSYESLRAEGSLHGLQRTKTSVFTAVYSLNVYSGLQAFEALFTGIYTAFCASLQAFTPVCRFTPVLALNIYSHLQRFTGIFTAVYSGLNSM